MGIQDLDLTRCRITTWFVVEMSLRDSLYISETSVFTNEEDARKKATEDTIVNKSLCAKIRPATVITQDGLTGFPLSDKTIELTRQR
ncbi:hypothetical protein HYV44_02980 [Candidatus Microgenomates bacterium]|nr:hypothetical protein [Candidatus Microgenomates bacterium]